MIDYHNVINMDLQMNTFNLKKHLLFTLTLACLAPLASQNAQAAAMFNSYASVTYTIDSITNLTNEGSFSGLGITGSFELALDQSFQNITGDGSVTPSFLGSGSSPLILGSSYTRQFQLDGVANNGGDVAASYLAQFGLDFENASIDTYAVGLTLSYEISAIATGDNAFTDVTLNYFAEHINASGDFALDKIFIGTDYISATTSDLGTAYLQKSPMISFILAPNEFESLYVGASISGNLQASPVPVPSALWLFASALLVIPSISKSKKTA